MASLYKKQIVTTDPKNGERVKTKSKKWWGRYKDETGKEKRLPLATDKAAAQAMLNQIVTREERKMAGIINPFDEHAKRPLLEHLADYRRYLESKENATTHIRQTTSCIKKLVAGCGFKTIRDLSPSRVANWLTDLRSKGRGARTSNAYLVAVKGFARWMVRDRRMAEDTLVHLSLLNSKVDVRRERRTLTPDEITN